MPTDAEQGMRDGPLAPASSIATEAHHARTSRYRHCGSYPGRVQLEADFFSAPIAKADVKMVSMDISVMHQNIKGGLPVANYNDMTFVFSDGD